VRKFRIVIEKAGKNYSAYSPDLPGCVATGKTHEETEERLQAVIETHIRGDYTNEQKNLKGRTVTQIGKEILERQKSS